MFEKEILPIISAIITVAITIFLQRVLKSESPVLKWEKNVGYGLISLALLSLVISLFWRVIPVSQVNLSSTATALISTSTKISEQIEGTKTAGTATAIAKETQKVVATETSIKNMTATQSAKSISISQKITDNAGLCNFATNPSAFQRSIDSYNNIFLSSVLFWIAVVIFFILIIVETQKRKIFVPLIVISLLIAVVLTISLASHPFFNLPNGPRTVSNAGYQEAMIKECDNYRQSPTHAVQTQIALQTQAWAPFATQTQLAVLMQSHDATVQAAAATIASNQTATQEAFASWTNKHSFLDEFTLDNHGWTGIDATSNVSLDRNQGILIYTSNPKSRISFWKCDLCEVPTDNKNYSFEIRYSAPEYPSRFNFGFLFGCSQFDKDRVDCQAVQFNEQSLIILQHLGKKEAYDNVSYYLQPNAKGYVNILIEVRDRFMSLKVNDKVVADNIKIDEDAGGMFGLYSDPPGYTVFLDRIEIKPLQ